MENINLKEIDTALFRLRDLWRKEDPSYDDELTALSPALKAMLLQMDEDKKAIHLGKTILTSRKAARVSLYNDSVKVFFFGK